MMLPGGVWQQGSLQREAAFRPVDGHLELALATAAGTGQDLPGLVSEALHAALAQLGSQAPDRQQVDALSVGDRQFLMSRLAGHLGLAQAWLSAVCSHCRSQFDFSLDYSILPAKPAARGYPFAEAKLTTGTVQLRVPTGADQRAILHLADEVQARQELAQRCIVGQPVALTEDDIVLIEAALEELAPELSTSVSAPCPECATDNYLEIDPYYCLGRVGNELFLEVHKLAAFYHWSEADILNLPRWRRKKYLGLIDRARGMTT